MTTVVRFQVRRLPGGGVRDDQPPRRFRENDAAEHSGKVRSGQARSGQARLGKIRIGQVSVWRGNGVLFATYGVGSSLRCTALVTFDISLYVGSFEPCSCPWEYLPGLGILRILATEQPRRTGREAAGVVSSFSHSRRNSTDLSRYSW